MSRHTETLRRLTEIRDVVTSLVAGETDRGSLEDEVARIVAAGAASAEGMPAARPGNGRTSAPADGGRHAGGNGQTDGQPALSTAQRPGFPGSAGSAGATARPGSSHGVAPGTSQPEARPQTSPASALQAGFAGGPPIPGAPDRPPTPSRATSGRPAPTGTSILPAEPALSPAAEPQSPTGRSSGPAPREIDETAVDLKIIKE
jgi:hypothetical protein